MALYESQKKAQAKYVKTHTKTITIRFNLRGDRDILDKLESTGNMQGYIKNLIRNDIKTAPVVSTQEYIHYGSRAYDPKLFNPIKNMPKTMAKTVNKPLENTGLWASPKDAKYSWADFCKDSGLKTYKKDDWFTFCLQDDASIYHIRSASDIWHISKNGSIDFEKALASGIDAIELHYSDNKSLEANLPMWPCDTLLVLNSGAIMA